MHTGHWHCLITIFYLSIIVSGFAEPEPIKIQDDRDVTIIQFESSLESFENDLIFQDVGFLGGEYSTDDSTNSSVSDSGKIYEWTPIYGNISAGERNVFIFSIDSGSTRQNIINSFEILIFISGNIYRQPSNITDKELRVYYSFNESILTDSSTGDFGVFERGYMQALATSPLEYSNNESVPTYSDLYVVIEPMNTTTNELLTLNSDTEDDSWHYKISISENDLVYQWDYRKWLDVLDTDHNSALLATGHGLSIVSYSNGDAEYNQDVGSSIDSSLYDIYLYSQNDAEFIESQMNRSLCAVTNGSYLATSANPKYSAETSAKVQLDNIDLAIVKNSVNRTWNFQEQFYITGLNSSSKYTVYLTKKIGRSGNISEVGGVLFAKSDFTTRDSNACSLIFDLDFCEGVAYSVPNSLVQPDNKTFLAETFDRLAESSYANFSKVLQNVPCDMEDDAVYSPLRTCKQCAHSYRNWLCAVTIPRCTNIKSSDYVYRLKDDNRNPYLNKLIRPNANYYEILPCIEMCHSIVRDCPSIFGFSCPDSITQKDLLLRSYNFFDVNSDYMKCNFIGNDTDIFTNLLST